MKTDACPVFVIIITHMSIDNLPFAESSKKYGYAPCIQMLGTKPGGHAYIAKVKETLHALNGASNSQLYVLMDAFDTYFRHLLPSWRRDSAKLTDAWSSLRS